MSYVNLPEVTTKVSTNTTIVDVKRMEANSILSKKKIDRGGNTTKTHLEQVVDSVFSLLSCADESSDVSTFWLKFSHSRAHPRSICASGYFRNHPMTVIVG